MTQNNQSSFAKAPRLFIDVDKLQEGRLELSQPHHHYLVNVMRLKQGDPVKIFNGIDGEWVGHLVFAGKKQSYLEIDACLRAQTPSPDLVYLFAPLKQARLDYMAQKAVEMGAGVLQPVITDYTQNSHVKLDKIRANAIEAAEQCELLSIPRVEHPLKLGSLLQEWPQKHPSRHILFCDESLSGSSPVHHILDFQDQELAVLIGPEGGFSPDERQALQTLDFITPISLGPRILRADTAGVAALAIVQALIGDWQNS